MKIQIKERFTDAVLFECEISAEVPERYRVREALQEAVKARADLTRANLAGAYLAGATYNIPPATPEEAIANLDKVREIILDKEERLDMGVWHDDDGWKVRTCAEETLCGTTHCLAGWLQVCSTNEEIRKLPNTEMAGALAAPIARHMFFESDERAINWLRDREYAKVES